MLRSCPLTFFPARYFFISRSFFFIFLRSHRWCMYVLWISAIWKQYNIMLPMMLSRCYMRKREREWVRGWESQRDKENQYLSSKEAVWWWWWWKVMRSYWTNVNVMSHSHIRLNFSKFLCPLNHIQALIKKLFSISEKLATSIKV